MAGHRGTSGRGGQGRGQKGELSRIVMMRGQTGGKVGYAKVIFARRHHDRKELATSVVCYRVGPGVWQTRGIYLWAKWHRCVPG